MIEQTYYPFGGETAILPTLTGNSSFISDENQNEGSANWLGWLLLIATLIGIAGLVYWWRSKLPKESPKSNVITEEQEV